MLASRATRVLGAHSGRLTVAPRRPLRPQRALASSAPQQVADYHVYPAAEAAFRRLLVLPQLDRVLEEGSERTPQVAQALAVEAAVVEAMTAAYGPGAAALALPLLPGRRLGPGLWDADTAVADVMDAGAGSSAYASLAPSDAAHLFLQRILFRINSLCHFWFDDIRSYENDRSVHLARTRDAIEAAWQAWEAEQMGPERVRTIQQMSSPEVKAALQQRYEADVAPPLSPVGRYIAQDMGLEGYKQLLAMASLDGLTEASRQSRVCAGAANSISNAVFRVLMEEYGSGRLERKHSTFFAAMMRELGLSDTPLAYFDTVPWQVLASANHNFTMTERRRFYLRYLGGLAYFEISGPAVYSTYLQAAQRLGLSERASEYWALHIREDERHGRWMLDDVAMPLADMYPADSWEVLLGYDMDKALAGRAAGEVLARVRAADARGFQAQAQAARAASARP